MLRPPVSNVTPLPTRTIGFSFAFPPLYSMMINCGSSEEPFATPSTAPIPSFCISFFPRIFTLSLAPTPALFAAAVAAAAKWFGVMSPPGVLESSRQAFTPLPTVCPCSNPFFIPTGVFPQISTSSTSLQPSFGFVLNVRNSKFAISKFSAMSEASSGRATLFICGNGEWSNSTAIRLYLCCFALWITERHKRMNFRRFTLSHFPTPISRISTPSSITARFCSFSVMRTRTYPFGAASIFLFVNESFIVFRDHAGERIRGERPLPGVGFFEERESVHPRVREYTLLFFFGSSQVKLIIAKTLNRFFIREARERLFFNAKAHGFDDCGDHALDKRHHFFLVYK